MAGPGSGVSSPRVGAIACATAVLIQCFGPVFIRQMHFGGLAVGFNRSWMGALFTIGLLYAKGERMSVEVLRRSMLGGISFGLNIATFFVAVRRTSIANASVIAGLQPILLLLVVNRFVGERARASQWVFSLAALSGVVLVVRGSSTAKTGEAFGDFLALLAMVLFAVYYIFSKKARVHLSTFQYQAGVLVWSTLVLLPLALISGTSLRVVDSGDWFWLGLMVLLPGTGHLLINWALANTPVMVPAVMNLFVPAGSTLLAWMVLDESLVGIQVFGIFVVIAVLAVMVISNDRSAAKGAAVTTKGASA